MDLKLPSRIQDDHVKMQPPEPRGTQKYENMFPRKKEQDAVSWVRGRGPHAHEVPPPAQSARPGSFVATPPFGAPQQQSFVAPQAASFAVRPPPAMAPPPVAGYLLEYVKIESHNLKINSIKQTLRDSFSAVSKPNFASKY